MKERFAKRESRLREFAVEAQNGNNPSPRLQKDFLRFTGEIAARKGLRMNVSGEALNDLVGTVLLKTYSAFRERRFEVIDAPIASWISVVAGNEVLYQATRSGPKKRWLKRKFNEMTAKTNVPQKRPVEEQVIINETVGEVFENMVRLSEVQKDALQLTMQGFSIPEASKHLGVNESVFRNRIYRGRQKLRMCRDKQE